MLDYIQDFKERPGSARMSHPLVFACDEAYAMQLSTTLRSIMESNRSGLPLDCHVLCDGFSEDTKGKVFDSLPKGSASIRWVPVDLGLFQEFATLPHISKMTFTRFLIPRIFPNTVSRVLYLDTDILVLDDLGPLCETKLEGAVLGAVLDGLDLHLKSGAQDLEKVPQVRDYFNAGVLLIDLDRWRKERISEKALEYLTQHPQSPFADQDALNFACDGLWKRLEPRWNFQPYYEKKKISEMAPEERPGIVHFVTHAKPWNASVPNLNVSFYDGFRSRTCFARTSEDKLWDILQGGWFHLKEVSRRYAFLRRIGKRIKPLVPR